MTTATNAVTLAIASQPGNGATLTCTTNPLAASAGVNAFAGCQIVGKAGTYTLSANSAGLTSATSASLTLSVGPATQVAFTTQPGGGANGATWNTQPVVSVEDSGGNVVTGATNSITLALGTQPVGGGTLACTTNPKAAAAGVATFSGCKITGKSGAYTLTATAAGLATATSNPLTISAGAATQLSLHHPTGRRGQRRGIWDPAGGGHPGCLGQRRHNQHLERDLWIAANPGPGPH